MIEVRHVRLGMPPEQDEAERPGENGSGKGQSQHQSQLQASHVATIPRSG
jgi:hypothetical protein